MRLSYNPLPEVIFLRCDRCGRAGRYRRASYVEIAGTDEPTVALREFARASGCALAALAIDSGLVNEPCGARYDLEALRDWISGG